MKTLPSLLLLILLVGCAAPNDVMFDGAKRAPTANVEVFRDGQKPDRPYKEIGELSQEYFTGEDAVVTKNFITTAKARGADGLIMLPGRDAAYRFDAFGRSGNRYVWRAVMIVWQPAKTASSSTQLDATR